MSREDFERHLQQNHLPLVTKLPGLRRLLLNSVLPNPNGPPSTFDVVSESWYDDPASMGVAFSSPEGEAVAADTANFADVARIQVLVVEEEEIALPTESATTEVG
jgi:uncharacterized protein (TIGR02118 family)